MSSLVVNNKMFRPGYTYILEYVIHMISVPT